MPGPGLDVTNDYQAFPSQNDIIGDINGLPVARTEKGFMVQDQSGWREPHPEEQKQIAALQQQAMTGSIGSDKINMGIRDTGAQKIKIGRAHV